MSDFCECQECDLCEENGNVRDVDQDFGLFDPRAALVAQLRADRLSRMDNYRIG